MEIRVAMGSVSGWVRLKLDLVRLHGVRFEYYHHNFPSLPQVFNHNSAAMTACSCAFEAFSIVGVPSSATASLSLDTVKPSAT